MKSYLMKRIGLDAYAFIENGKGELKGLDKKLNLRNHSPDGFEWGYTGSGPAQLALAILADCVGDEKAEKYYQQFKNEMIATQPREANFSFTDQFVKTWVEMKDNG